MDFTPIVRPFFAHRVKESLHWISQSEKIQRQQLMWMIKQARNTQWGVTHDFSTISSYEDFATKVPITPYEKIRPLVERMIAGERDVLWKGMTTHFAQSSGTSDGKSKYIPITSDSFTRCHYRGGTDVVAHYLNLYPDSRMFSGKGFILGGSYGNELKSLPKGVVVGDLSANLIDNINPLVNIVRVPSKKIALMEDWAQKLPAL
ncbi:MAG: GH3 auxin-responsive promoter family protein, partial [Muribaculaceae bacterium]|nr:GH3 auxin-responsive promoter family protein [Muribaculaceae bacterium]